MARSGYGPAAVLGCLRFAAGLFVLTALWADVACADGAIAIGLPSNIAKQGVAVGTSWNYDDADGAHARALKECLGFMDAPPDTRKLCEVVKTFTHECIAVAIDPKAGTPGFGWAVAPVESGAEKAAMKNCKDTAGRDRQKYCVVTVKHCDGK